MISYVTMASDILLNIFNYRDYKVSFCGDVFQLLFIVKYLNLLNTLNDEEPLISGRIYYQINNEVLFVSRDNNEKMNTFILMEE